MRSTEPVLKAACEECRWKSKVLYCTACGHTTLCASCGRYNFSKIAWYKQLTLEEAEGKMNKKGTIAARYQRWMMKRATNRPATFGLNMKNVYAANGEATDRVRAKRGNTNEDGNHSDKCEDDDEAAQKKRLGLTKMSIDDDNGGVKDPNSDPGDEIEKDDDSEHEEIFTDGDEAVDIDTEQIAALAEFPVPPEIKQDDDENEEGNLSKSGKEFQKLLKCAYVPNELDAYEEDGSTPVLSPKQKDQPKNKPVDNSPAKPTLSSVHAHGTPSASKSRGKKRSWGGDAKTSNGTAPRGLNVESAAQTSGGKDDASSSKPTLKSSVTAQDDTNVCPVTEKEIRSIILTEVPIAKEDLYADLSLEGKVALKRS